MTHTNTNNDRQPNSSLSLAVRAWVAVSVIAVLAGVWTVAERSSREAVQEARATLNRTYVTLPRVEIAAKREPADVPVVVHAAKRPPLG